MLEERDKWLFKVVGFIILIITIFVILIFVAGGSLSIPDLISWYGIPVGLLGGWGIVVCIEEKNKKKK